MSEKEIIDFDDWSKGTIVTKDGKTFYKVIGRQRLDERIKYRLKECQENGKPRDKTRVRKFSPKPKAFKETVKP